MQEVLQINKESILIFGGGVLQTSIINTAREKGFYTIVIDPDENAVGKNYADEFLIVDGNDYDKTISIINKYKVKGLVTAATDKPLLVMAKIAEKMNFKFPSYESILNSTYKDFMKKCFQDNNIPCAKGITLNNEDIFNENNVKELKIPLIVKPVDSSGSRGVTAITDFAKLKEAVEYARSFSREKRVLIEEYIKGPEISVESLTFNNNTIILQITDKITTNPPYNVELGHTQPTSLSKKNVELVEQIVIKAIKALGLNNCACHTELKITPSGPVIIENGARLGGDFITSVLVPTSTGINIESAVIDIAVGQTPNINFSLRQGVAIRYLNLPTGKIKRIRNWESILDIPNIIKADFKLKEGDNINQITDSINRYGYIISKGKDRIDAINMVDSALKYFNSMIDIE